MKEKFIRAVENGDIVDVRFFISNELLLDSRGKSFCEMREFAELRRNDLYEIDNGIKYSYSPEEWDEPFLYKLKNDLDSNFSCERLDLYEKVAKKVLKTKAAKLDEEELYSQQAKDNEAVDETKTLNRKYIYGGVAAASAATTIAGLCSEKTGITITGIIGLVTSGYLLYKEFKKEGENE